MKVLRAPLFRWLAHGRRGYFALALSAMATLFGRRRFLLEGAGVGAEGQDVSKSDAPVDYIGEAGQLHDLRDDASPGL